MLKKWIAVLLAVSFIIPLPVHAEETEDASDSHSTSMAFGSSGWCDLSDQVPLYAQEDYPDVPYGDSTVAEAGCGITALAMVASSLSGEEVLPDTLANRFGFQGASHIQRLESAATALGLSYQKSFEWEEVVYALISGHLVIMMVNQESAFTESQHFLVLTGINQEERILVRDPSSKHYGMDNLKDGFANGFSQQMLSQGFSGAWIFQTNDSVRQEESTRPDVPLYLQTDYPDVPYSDGTVATSGCAMACIAMVATYMTGTEYLPDTVARRFGNYEASNVQRMEAASMVFDLSYRKTTDWNEIIEALTEGKPVIAMMEKASVFTASQHMVVLTGISEDNRIWVNDPYGPNYKKQELKDGFANGFERSVISYGCSGGWIYDAYTPPAPRQSRYPDIQLTEDEKYLLASIIWLEARGESFEGQQAIAEIVFNRMVSDRFSNTIQGVIFAEGQFATAAFLDQAKPGELQYKAIESALTGESVLPIDVVFFGQKARTEPVWGVIGGHVFSY